MDYRPLSRVTEADEVVSTERVRAHLIAPRVGRQPILVEAFQVLLEHDRATADAYLAEAVDATDGRHGVGMAGWAALVVNAYSVACDELGLPQPTDVPIQAARNAVAFVAENAVPCLETGHWSAEDVLEQLRHAVEMLDRVLERKGVSE